MGKIINIRGTSGSGKSFVVHAVKSKYTTSEALYDVISDTPVGYVLTKDGIPPLFLAGHYEIVCGGCDTLESIEAVYELVHKHAQKGMNVLYEGLVVQSDVTRCINSRDYGDLEVVFLDEPLEICLSSVESRRIERGTTEEFNPKNTVLKAVALPPQKIRFRAAGVNIFEYTRQQALQHVLNSLSLDNSPIPERVRYPDFLELTSHFLFPFWMASLRPLFAKGTILGREKLATRFLATRERVVAAPHNVSEHIINGICTMFPIYKNLRTEIDRPGKNIAEMVQGVDDAAWQARRSAMRQGYVQNTARAARIVWADWAYAKELDKLAHELLDYVDGVCS